MSVVQSSLLDPCEINTFSQFKSMSFTIQYLLLSMQLCLLTHTHTHTHTHTTKTKNQIKVESYNAW